MVSVINWVKGAPAKALGEKTMTKLMPKLRQFTLRRLATLAVSDAAEHIDRNPVADREAEALRDVGLHRDQRRPGIIFRPPFAGDHLRALRRLVGKSHAAVAFQRPSGLVGGLDLFRRGVLHPHDAAAQHRRDGDGPLRRLFMQEGAELGRLRALHVEKEKARRILGQRLADFGAQVAFDADQRRQQRDAEPERNQEGGRQGAGTVEIGDGETQGQKCANGAPGARKT